MRETGLVDWLQFGSEDTLTGYIGAESRNKRIIVGQREYGMDTVGHKKWYGLVRVEQRGLKEWLEWDKEKDNWFLKNGENKHSLQQQREDKRTHA